MEGCERGNRRRGASVTCRLRFADVFALQVARDWGGKGLPVTLLVPLHRPRAAPLRHGGPW